METGSLLCNTILDSNRQASLKSELLLTTAILLCAIFAANEYQALVIARLCVFAMAAAGLTFGVRYFGLLSLGHAGMLAIGAYVGASLAKALPDLSLVCPLVGGASCLLLGWILVPAIGKLVDVGYSMVTLVFGITIETFIRELPRVTGGAQGLADIPVMGFGGYSLGPTGAAVVSLGLLVLTLRGCSQLDLSHIGRSMQFCGRLPVAASSYGFSPRNERGRAFLLSSILCGVAGATGALLEGYIAPSSYDFEKSLNLLAAAVVAGTCSPVALLLASAMFVVIPDLYLPSTSWRLVLVGATLLIVQRLVPNGIGPVITAWITYFRRNVMHSSFDQMPHSIRHMEGEPAFERAGSTTGSVALHELRVNLHETTILHNVSVILHSGRAYSLSGPNGSGKTTLLNVLTGMQSYNSGALEIFGKRVEAQKNKTRRHSIFENVTYSPRDAFLIGIRRTFQSPQIVEDLTALENISLGMDSGRKGNLLTQFFWSRYPSAVPKLYDAECLPLLPSGRWLFLGRDLTTSERRAVELLRAVISPGAMLLADEPASGLAPDETNAMVEFLRSLRRAFKIVLLVEHKPEVASRLCDDELILDQGVLTQLVRIPR